jgi:hypothetical protein
MSCQITLGGEEGLFGCRAKQLEAENAKLRELISALDAETGDVGLAFMTAAERAIRLYLSGCKE